MIFYTGIGSRETPKPILLKMKAYATAFAKLGYTLRSGGAHGADTAFEKGAKMGLKEIYLPWKGFNGNDSCYYGVSDEALKIAAEVYGPRWSKLSTGAKSLMARNIYQIMGKTLDTPSKFVLCYTHDGAASSASRSRPTGGTGQAIDYASRNNIPVFNLRNVFAEDWLLDFIGELND